METSDIIATLLIVFVIPLFFAYGVIAVIIGAYATTCVVSWLFGLHPEWSLLDVVQLPFQEVLAIAMNNLLLFFIFSIVIVLMLFGIGRSRKN